MIFPFPAKRPYRSLRDYVFAAENGAKVGRDVMPTRCRGVTRQLQNPLVFMSGIFFVCGGIISGRLSLV